MNGYWLYIPALKTWKYYVSLYGARLQARLLHIGQPLIAQEKPYKSTT